MSGGASDLVLFCLLLLTRSFVAVRQGQHVLGLRIHGRFGGSQHGSAWASLQGAFPFHVIARTASRRGATALHHAARGRVSIATCSSDLVLPFAQTVYSMEATKVGGDALWFHKVRAGLDATFCSADKVEKDVLQVPVVRFPTRKGQGDDLKVQQGPVQEVSRRPCVQSDIDRAAGASMPSRCG